MKEMFKMRGVLTKKQTTVSRVLGSVIIVTIWFLVVELGLIPKSILPSPLDILISLKSLHFDDAIVNNAGYSFLLNIAGLAEAALFAIPIGFAIGLFPILDAVFEKYISAMRFIPLTAIIGMFIVWFGIGTNMKIQFLAFTIFLYLLPVVIQKIKQVEAIYIQTAQTCGATNFHLVFKVYAPLVVSRVFDDLKILAALSWTYIIIAELVNATDGGIGALSFKVAKQSRTDKVFAILLVIVIIGFIQDWLLTRLDKMFFPYKYATKEK